MDPRNGGSNTNADPAPLAQPQPKGSPPRLKPGRPRATTTSTQATQLASPTPTAVTTMSSSTLPRKVRTVPPSAMLDPPTPTEQSQPTFDTARIEHPKRRRRRFRSYWSSEDESSSDESSSTDDEPPWWTFTQRGMAKLRSRDERPTPPPQQHGGSISEAPNDTGPGSDLESGRDSVREPAPAKRKRTRIPFSSTPPRQNSGGAAPGGSATATPIRTSASRIFQPRPLRAPWPRRSTDLTGAPLPLPSAVTALSEGDGPGMMRSTSEPIPNPDIPGPTPSTSVDVAGSRISSPERPPPITSRQSSPERPSPADSTPSTKRPKPKRFLSMPQRRSQDDTPLTDSELTPAASSPRVRAKQRLWNLAGLHGIPDEEEDGDVEDGAVESDTAGNRPRARRLNTQNLQNLRLRIPAHVSEHFAGGWPHAGSWQQALHYGMMDEEGVVKRRHSAEAGQPKASDRRRHSTDQTGQVKPITDTMRTLVAEPDAIGSPKGTSPRNASIASIYGSAHGHSSANGHSAHGHAPSPSLQRSSLANDTDTSTGLARRARGLRLDLSSIETPPRARKKTKSRRTRRYRPALVPPTPGPGSLHHPTREVIGAEHWGANEGPTPDPDTNPFDRVNPFDRIDEEYPFSDEVSASEKPRGHLFRRRKRARNRPLDGLSRKEKLRRMLFLDARLTIYIRLWNLAIAVTLLALALTVRIKLTKLGVIGIVGPSTTLIIAYSCLTVVHAVTAIYREYFGRPIGLWGMRSKMLWVCLDLLFIALWSSAATLAINDYIDTPLDCTPLAPWWSGGRDYSDIPESSVGARAVAWFDGDVAIADTVKYSSPARSVCRRQVGLFSVCIVALLLYCGNMVLSLFRIFETVRRTANPIRTVSV